MEDIFPIPKNFCNRFLEKNNPKFNIPKLPKYLDKILSEETLELAKTAYFTYHLCFLHGKTPYLLYFNYPTIDVADDLSKLFMLQIYKLYELKKYKMTKIPNLKRDDKYIIFNNQTNPKKISQFLLLNSLRIGNTYSIPITDNDKQIITAINLSKEFDFFDKNNLENIFNGYLRNNLGDIFRLMAQEKVPSDQMENFIEKYFLDLIKKDHNYIANSKKEFLLQYNSFTQKLLNYFKTKEYKKFEKSVISSIKPFKFPLKEYFGKDKPLQYQLFKNLLHNFPKFP